ncbi:MAG TPA: S8 family serine peptidase [Candidatus Dormibacteraeota bacterium]|nr:S8 family serine peptidase [Candidatus Dormibacteraeota bacterium]
MKFKILCLLLFFCGLLEARAAPQLASPVPTTPAVPLVPVTAGTRFIVRNPYGLASLQQLCLALGCNVAGAVDGALGKLFLVTAPSSIDPNVFLQTLRSHPEVTNAELDALLKVMQSTTSVPPSGLTDSAPVNYFGTSVWHGYVAQPAGAIVRLPDTQLAFNVTGAGIVADIDTGVDPSHPVLQPVLLSGYDFTRNQPIGSEMTDFTGAPPPANSRNVAKVNQSTAAVLDQSTAAVLDQGPQFGAFGHGTMVAGIIHLVAPTSQIMPLKAFQADGTGYLSNVLRAVYFAVQNGANVINMSFSLPTYSTEMARAVKFAVHHQVICVASAGNDGKEEIVYPAGLSSVMGVASTANDDSRSTFSNYGGDLVWVAAPGEGVITTYPFGTYAAGWGTSFSAPMVSGGAALLLSFKASCNESCAETSLAHAVPISSDLGNGRLDLYQAVAAWRDTLNQR